MVAVCFTVLAVIAIVSISVEIVMRVRLTQREIPSQKLLWWRRGGDDVEEAYQELFPGTQFPFLRKLAFGLVAADALMLLVSILWKSF
jgi:hypothetical protein